MIFHLSSSVTIAIDFAIWLVIHVFVSVIISIMRPDTFNPESQLYKERFWEKEGRIYQTFLRINKWKGLLPDGAAVSKSGFRKKHLDHMDEAYLKRFIQETCRAELTHLVIFLFSVAFFIWNEWWIGFIMIAYGFIVNMPCIVTQRYNRIRLKRIYGSHFQHAEEILRK